MGLAPTQAAVVETAQIIKQNQQDLVHERLYGFLDRAEVREQREVCNKMNYILIKQLFPPQIKKVDWRGKWINGHNSCIKRLSIVGICATYRTK